MKTWLRFALKRFLESFFLGSRLLARDSFSYHIMDTVKDKVKKISADMLIVPGGCTEYIQASDVCWNVPFKELLTERYDE